jgi:hypothetical protein
MSGFKVTELLAIAIVFLPLYFIPSINAYSRKHKNTAAIFALNLLLGWSFLGWVGALVWSQISQVSTLRGSKSGRDHD